MFVRLVGVRKSHAGEFLSYIQHEEKDSDRQGSQNTSCGRWCTLCISLQARWKRATTRPQLMPSAKMFLATAMKTSWTQFPWTWFISLMGGNGHIQIWEWFGWTDLLTQILLASTVHSSDLLAQQFNHIPTCHASATQTIWVSTKALPLSLLVSFWKPQVTSLSLMCPQDFQKTWPLTPRLRSLRSELYRGF